MITTTDDLPELGDPELRPRPIRGGGQDVFYGPDWAAQLPLIVRGDGIYLWDDAGRRYIDVSSGAFLCNLGQGNPRVVRAMADQAQRMTYAYVRNARNRPDLELAETLSALAGPGFERVHFSSGGSDAIEMAIKLLRQHAIAKGQPERTRVISLMPSYHGAGLGTIALTGDTWSEPVYGPLVGFSERIPAPLTCRAESPEAAAAASSAALEAAIRRLGPETVLAFIMEPIGAQATGANAPHPSFYSQVREICSRHGVSLVYDEVVSAFRTGRFLAAHHEPDALPDIAVMAKGLGAGYVPIGAVLAPARIVDAVAARGGFNLSFSASGNPISCATALAVVREVLERDLIAAGARAGERLRAGLEKLRETSPLIGDVRGKGLLLGIELVRDKATLERFGPEVDPAARLRWHGMRHGLLMLARRMNAGRFGDWVVIAPPLISSDADIDELLERLALAVGDAADELLAG